MTRPVPKSYGANGGKPRKWRRRRLVWRFLRCDTCGGGKRRHVLFDTDDDGGLYACSRAHHLRVQWTRDEKWRRDSITIFKHVYAPILTQHLVSSGLLSRCFK